MLKPTLCTGIETCCSYSRVQSVPRITTTLIPAQGLKPGGLTGVIHHTHAYRAQRFRCPLLFPRPKRET